MHDTIRCRIVMTVARFRFIWLRLESELITLALASVMTLKLFKYAALCVVHLIRHRVRQLNLEIRKHRLIQIYGASQVTDD